MSFANQTFLIVLDLDGTLLTTEKTISEKTVRYLQSLESRGNRIAIASGRPKRAILPYYQQLDLKGPMIGYNGALIEDPHDPSFVPFHKRIPRECIEKFLAAFPPESFENLMTETDTDLYFLKPKPEYDNFFHADGMKVHYGDFRGLLSEDPYPFLFETRDGTRDSAMSSLVNTFPDLGLRFWWDAPRMGEFYHYQVNKSVAIRHIAKHYGYDRAHTIAFGDAENDIEMLSDAGISFAMKNGSKDLAKVASYVTEEDDDHDGVMVALQHLFGDR